MKLEQLHRTLLKINDMYYRAIRGIKYIEVEEQIDPSNPDDQEYLASIQASINPTNITLEDVAREIRAIEEQVPDFGVRYLGQFRGNFVLYPRAQEGCLNTVEEWAEALKRYAIAEAEEYAKNLISLS